MKKIISVLVFCIVCFACSCQERVDGFKVYPNPTSGVVHIECGGRCVDSLEVKLCNMVGQVVVSDQMRGNYHIMNIDSLERGVYMFTVSGCSEDKKVYHTIKIVKR